MHGYSSWNNVLQGIWFASFAKILCLALRTKAKDMQNTIFSIFFFFFAKGLVAYSLMRPLCIVFCFTVFNMPHIFHFFATAAVIGFVFFSISAYIFFFFFRKFCWDFLVICMAKFLKIFWLQKREEVDGFFLFFFFSADISGWQKWCMWHI